MFVNEQTGIIDILKAGRGINASGIFVNKNVVKIDSCFSYGIVLTISGFLHNIDSITISNSFRSILIGGEFENSHYLSVLNGTGEGMGLDHFGSYRSAPNSYFELQSTTPMFIDTSSVIDIQGEFVLKTND